MASKRMFNLDIVDSDAFLSMPASTQNLYFHLALRADDDGFNNKPYAVMAQAHATNDDLKILAAKKFIILFESGVIVIKHWRIHNTIRKDTYKPTKYGDEFRLLQVDNNGSYRLPGEYLKELPALNSII